MGNGMGMIINCIPGYSKIEEYTIPETAPEAPTAE